VSSAAGGIPARVWALVIPVWVAGGVAVLVAAERFVDQSHAAEDLAGIGAFFVVSMLAERYPVQIHGVDAGGVSLGFVFAAATVVLFGWEAAVIVGGAAPALVQTLERRPFVRVAYNAAVCALGALAAGALIAPIDGSAPVNVLVEVVLAFAALFLVDWVLVNLVLSLYSGRPYHALLATTLRQMVVPAVLMASAALMLVVLWQRSPLFSVALVGPLVAIAVYQRSQFRELRALRQALTDPLTGLGNNREFHERLRAELIDADENGASLSLVLVDLDDFRELNEELGHHGGDRALMLVGALVRERGEAFRLGGDEFALLLPETDADAVHAMADSLLDRIGALRVDGHEFTASAGLATYPSEGVGRDDLLRLADTALHWAKEQGKDQARAWRGEDREAAEARHGAGVTNGDVSRYRAAEGLAKAVDARDAQRGGHSERVAELAARLAARLGADEETVELTRLAGTLHDLGELGVPEEILRKPEPLTEAERAALERHSQIGSRMLQSLGVDSVAAWVRHHHERWDGTGYPDGLAGEEIPLGSRIVLVADAFDAMTSDSLLRPARSTEDALEELQREAGTQFDPAVVAAMIDEMAYEAA
jgi:diguanylate cyclase (GGDEF)-like protein